MQQIYELSEEVKRKYFTLYLEGNIKILGYICVPRKIKKNLTELQKTINLDNVNLLEMNTKDTLEEEAKQGHQVHFLKTGLIPFLVYQK